MNANPTFAIYTLGCKLNYSESSAIGQRLAEQGFSKVNFKEKADVYIINTCSVTNEADKECRMVVRNALNTSPEAFIAVIGCYAQLKPEDIAKIDGVDIVLGASEKFNIANFLPQIRLGRTLKNKFAEIHSCEIEQPLEFHASYSSGDRTRSFLKVQDGCDYSCSYCTIPLARGASRSNTVENVVKDVYEIASKGVKEIVLTGVNLGDFGLIKGERTETFFDLVQELEKVTVPVRFRISSIEPNLLTDEIIRFVSTSEKFVPHFHIPLQSGSNTILKAMRRRYLRELYVDRVALIKSLMPHCCIGADVISGFPGETEELFLETYNFLNELDVSYLHAFTYSERSNTLAAESKEIVPMEVRKKRTRMLRILSEKKLRNFYTQNLGQEKVVLFEGHINDGWQHGHTDNYVRVRIPSHEILKNSTYTVRLNSINEEGTVDGEIVHTLQGISSDHLQLITVN
ncbi:MAG TPA: tRNA (N(6)-L-threonylcarbamoyladenosine(37)-C(2))-methylthiotransferase MtaB [Bacteroidia bacterium]|nr:tRNA (N(6)-L-threonylcarbamoyladenosine(37)-C(2))-methylthiotransferase MtaB [Bacteroidia bacterium]